MQAKAPKHIEKKRNFFLACFLSEMAPNVGDNIANNKPDRAKTQPKRSVLTIEATPSLQYFLKNNGKKPAITVVKKTLFAESYSAQDKIFLFIFLLCQDFTAKASLFALFFRIEV